MELLEMIADQVDTETGILSMRLACKELSAAAFKSFSDEYFDEVSCFMLDPKRLLRAKHIISTPHLARRVTSFNFTLNHLDREDCLVFATAQHETDAEAMFGQSQTAADKHGLFTTTDRVPSRRHYRHGWNQS